ncbi:MAG: hypothetical protein EOM03_06395 [Clostridia bacterium]|nr:hypothetical protein [Clostridia bacterium]
MIAGVAIFVSASRHPFTYYLQPMTSVSLPTLPIIETRLYAGLVKFMDKAIEEGDLKAFSQLLKLHLKIRALELARERFEFSAAQATLKHAAQINEINAMEELSFDEKADLLRTKLWDHPEPPQKPKEPQMSEEPRESPSVESATVPKPQPAAPKPQPAVLEKAPCPKGTRLGEANMHARGYVSRKRFVPEGHTPRRGECA